MSARWAACVGVSGPQCALITAPRHQASPGAIHNADKPHRAMSLGWQLSQQSELTRIACMMSFLIRCSQMKPACGMGA